MPEENKIKKEDPKVDLDTSGPEVSISTMGSSCFILFSSGIVPSYVNICAGYLLDPEPLLKFHLH